MRKCDIIIPVYNAYDFLRTCIDSVLKNTNFEDTRLILIDDKSPDERVLFLLEKYAAKNPKKVVLLKNEKNMGFVRTVNRGMKYAKNDVLLLNSDTEVPEGWLERMQACMESDKTIATVTPLSNNETPVRLAEGIRKLDYSDGRSFEEVAKIVKEHSMRLYPDLPSAHGFCMLIRREAIEKVGYFDEETFGKGYGEENDFCFRCFAYGYRHALCDDVYVLHAGSQSFLDKKKLHDDELRAKHPKIRAEVDVWYLKQGLEKISDNVTLAVGAKKRRKNLLLLAGGEDLSVAVKKCNVHVLKEGKGHCELRSNFETLDLKTAFYEKPVTIGGRSACNLQKREMIEEIVDIFGISVICDLAIDKNVAEVCKMKNIKYVVVEDGSTIEKTLEECGKWLKVRAIDFERARNKMLECDFVKALQRAAEVEQMLREEEERKKSEREIAKDREWREGLTLYQRAYLKVRYIFTGR